jgi:hypothetical protein
MPTDLDQARADVADAITVLDVTVPDWWHRRPASTGPIRTSLIQIASDSDCILGQMYGSYSEAPKTLRDLNATSLDLVMTPIWALNHAWREAIEYLRWREEIMSS